MINRNKRYPTHIFHLYMSAIVLSDMAVYTNIMLKKSSQFHSLSISSSFQSCLFLLN